MTLENIMTLRRFVASQQVAAMLSASRGEEGEYFRAKVAEYAERFTTMPETYAQDGMGDAAIVHLHYFKGACDWYITERDMEHAQHQAFGYANLGDDDCAELGYISIVELIQNDVELDLHWQARTLGECKVKQGA